MSFTNFTILNLRKLLCTNNFTRFSPKFSSSCLFNKEVTNKPTINEISNVVPVPSKKTSTDEGAEFRYLLKNSDFVYLGDPENKFVAGKIFHVVKDDLYIDFGWKFYCVCPRPTKSGHIYVRGASVLLRIKSLELSTRFLGSEKDLTLLEADASIEKLLYSPFRSS